MLTMNTNEIIIDKHSSSIQISNKISALQRKSYNYMLKVAKNEFKKNKNARIFTITQVHPMSLYFYLKNHQILKNTKRTISKKNNKTTTIVPKIANST